QFGGRQRKFVGRQVKDEVLFAEVLAPRGLLNGGQQFLVQGQKRLPHGLHEVLGISQSICYAKQCTARQAEGGMEGDAHRRKVENGGLRRCAEHSQFGKIQGDRGKLRTQRRRPVSDRA